MRRLSIWSLLEARHPPLSFGSCYGNPRFSNQILFSINHSRLCHFSCCLRLLTRFLNVLVKSSVDYSDAFLSWIRRTDLMGAFALNAVGTAHAI